MTAPLYIKTHNSLLESLITVKELVTLANKNNISSLTITDNTMYGVLEFYHACKENNIKPIIGLEINNILLYAKNEIGYKNLLKLTTIASKEEITLNILKQYANDLVAIIPFSEHIHYNQYSFYEDIFQGYANLEEREQLIGKNLVYCNEILYLEEKDKEYLPYLYAIGKGVSMEEISFSKTDNHLLNYQIYVQDIENNEKIVSLCNVEIPIHQDLLPIYSCPDGLDSYHYLKQLIIDGLKNIFGEKVNKIYLDRLKYELDVINKMGFCNYFLIVWDYVKFAKEQGILVGTGRGSAAGSLVSYCLGITNIDPIEYDLLFERFLNPERISMPDIDIDFEYTRREEIITYCISKYGLKKVAPIITFGTLGSKQVIRDVGKCLKVDLKVIDHLSKLIDAKLSLLENYQTNPKIKQYLEIQSDLQKLYQVAIKLEGLKRHTSIHAAGIVMSRYDLDEIIPLSYHDSFYTTGYSMEYLEELGLLKMDILALKNLTLLNDVLKEVNISLEDIPLHDEETLAIFTNVDTNGIFQFESGGMINFLKKFKPTTFEDIVAAIALFRPGPMHNIDSYIRRKNNEEEIDYFDDSLISILKPTYGIIIYQEQIMQIANVLAGYSLAEADLLRKAMSKKKEEILLKEKDKFIKQSTERGYSEEVARKVYDLILKFASYGFNRAHSVAYAMIAYKMAYLKAHYPDIFLKHLLSMVIGSEVKTKEYITAYQDKVEVTKPDINISRNDYFMDQHKIIYPFTNIKNVGAIAGNLIIEERKKGLFKDIFDFFARCYGKVVNHKVVQSLIKAGCFDSLGFNQKTLDNSLEILENYSELGSLLEDSLKPELVIYEEYTQSEIIAREIEVFGTFMSNHPVSEFRKSYEAIYLKDINQYFDQTIISIIHIDKTKKITTKKNESMLFITGSDETGIADFVLFPKMFQDNIAMGSIYLIKGKVEKRFDKYQIVVHQLKKIG